jgi:type IV secretion system protein VirB10
MIAKLLKKLAPGGAEEIRDALPTEDVPLPTRDRAAVASAASLQSRLQRMVGLVVLGGVGGLLVAWQLVHQAGHSATPHSPSADARRQSAESEAPLPPLVTAARSPDAVPPGLESAHPVGTSDSHYRIGSILGDVSLAPHEDGLPTMPSAALPPGISPAPKSAQQVREERFLAGTVLTRPASITVEPGRPAVVDSQQELPTAAASSGGPHPLHALLSAEAPLAATATVLPTQRLLLPKGNSIDCTLETAIESTLPGLATCLTAVGALSADGNVVLLERGTKLIGETRGDVAPGSARVFVLWTEARTPAGVVVPLASPGTDALGRSGLPGTVDRHFLDRFGAAILISMIDGAVQAVAAHQAGGNGSLVLNPNGTRDVMTEVLRGTLSIPPTVRVNQGARIAVLVARDLDFRAVYTLRGR